MKMTQDPADAKAAPALLLWSRLIQGAAGVVIVLSLTLLLAPRLGEAIFNLVYYHQFSIPVEVPSLALGYIWFANGIIGAVMAGWMNCIIQNEHLNSTMVDTKMDFLKMDFRGTSAATFTR